MSEIQRYDFKIGTEWETFFLHGTLSDDGYYVLYTDHLADKEEADIAWKSELKKQFEAGIAIIHDQGAENILLKEQIAALTAALAEDDVKKHFRKSDTVVECTFCGLSYEKDTYRRICVCGRGKFKAVLIDIRTKPDPALAWRVTR